MRDQEKILFQSILIRKLVSLIRAYQGVMDGIAKCGIKMPQIPPIDEVVPNEYIEN